MCLGLSYWHFQWSCFRECYTKVMNLIQILPQLPWLKIIIASAAYFVIRALWYSPVLFSKWWADDNNFSKDFFKQKMNMPLIFGGSFFMMFLAVTNLSLLLGPKPIIQFAIMAGALIGSGFMASAVGINCLYTRKPFRLFVVDGMYHVVGMMAAGSLLSLLR